MGVRATIQRILREQGAGVRSGTEAMRDILKALQGDVMAELGRAALGSWDAYHLRQVLDAIEVKVAGFETKAKAELGRRLTASWETGKALVDSPLEAAGVRIGGFHLSESVLETLQDFAFHKVEGLRSFTWDRIRSELALGTLGQRTPQEVAKAIGRNLTDRSIFSSIDARGEVITRTEMGRVFSTSAQKRMEQAGEHVPGMEKQWLHSGHPRKPRPSHLSAHGQHVPVDEKFNIGGVMMLHPRDPGAPLDEIINCGCEHVPYHPDWGE